MKVVSVIEIFLITRKDHDASERKVVSVHRAKRPWACAPVGTSIPVRTVADSRTAWESRRRLVAWLPTLVNRAVSAVTMVNSCEGYIF